MATPKQLWAKFPKWMRTHQTVRGELNGYNEKYDKEKKNDRYEDRPIDEANLITSLDTAGWGGFHRPVLDIDHDLFILESSTKGNHHLMIDKLVPTHVYFKLLDVMAEAEILEPGYVEACKKRGATGVRLPWVKKDDFVANAFDPKEFQLTVEEEIAKTEAKLKDLKNQLKTDPLSMWLTG